MKSFSTTISIAAPRERIWTVLVDVVHWPEWNSTVRRVSGEAALGKTVTVEVTANPGRAFPVRVSALEAPRRMVWTGGMPLGLFTGTRVFELAEGQGMQTVFRMREDYRGPLASLIGRSIPDLQPSFDEFARCLKQRTERG